MVKVTRPPSPQLTKVDAPVTPAPRAATTAAPPPPPKPESSMAAPRASGPKAPAQQKVEQQVATLGEGPIRQALLHALSGALPAPVIGAATAAIAGFTAAQQKELSNLLSKAGQSATASPRADANAERAFLLAAVARGAADATLKRLAQQIRGRPPSNLAFSFNPMAGATTKRAASSNPAEATAQKLKAAMDDIWGTDEDAVFEALESVDPSLLPQVAERYQKLTGTSLQDALGLELEGADLKRALAALGRKGSAAPTAPVKAPAKVAAATSVSAASSVSAADVAKNLDAIKVVSKDAGVVKCGNAVELNELIPSNVPDWKPPKAHVYNPLRAAVRERNKAQKALDAAKTEPAKKAAQAKLDAADKKVAAEGDKVKTWLREHITANPELQRASAAVVAARRAPGKAGLAEAEAEQKKVKDALLARVDAYQPMVDVRMTGSDVTVDGRTVRMHDAVDTAYTNSWNAVDGGAVSGDSDAVVAAAIKESGISDDRQKLLAFVSGIEGTFSKVNTWDIGRVSWGFAQWTLGKTGNGSLAEFMRDLKTTDPALYEKSFGKYGLDIDPEGVVLTRPDGTVLKGVAAAEAIRTDVKLAAVFMAAGADPAMQKAQVKAASEGKISGTRNHSVKVTGKNAEGAPVKAKLRLKDVVTSEYGNAILTDLAVNAGSGIRVAEKALKEYVKDHGLDPAKVSEWGPDAEKAVIAALEKRSRSERLDRYRAAGFSKEPHSFSD